MLIPGETERQGDYTDTARLRGQAVCIYGEPGARAIAP